MGPRAEQDSRVNSANRPRELSYRLFQRDGSPDQGALRIRGVRARDWLEKPTTPPFRFWSSRNPPKKDNNNNSNPIGGLERERERERECECSARTAAPWDLTTDRTANPEKKEKKELRGVVMCAYLKRVLDGLRSLICWPPCLTRSYSRRSRSSPIVDARTRRFHGFAARSSDSSVVRRGVNSASRCKSVSPRRHCRRVDIFMAALACVPPCARVIQPVAYRDSVKRPDERPPPLSLCLFRPARRQPTRLSSTREY